MKKAKLTRRQFVATSAAASAMVAAPFVRTAHAAGKLSIMFWDHWVPGGNNASKALCEEWAAKEKVDLQIDYITSQGHKNLLTIAAEAQAKSGHDILAFPTWQPPTTPTTSSRSTTSWPSSSRPTARSTRPSSILLAPTTGGSPFPPASAAR